MGAQDGQPAGDEQAGDHNPTRRGQVGEHQQVQLLLSLVAALSCAWYGLLVCCQRVKLLLGSAAERCRLSAGCRHWLAVRCKQAGQLSAGCSAPSSLHVRLGARLLVHYQPAGAGVS